MKILNILVKIDALQNRTQSSRKGAPNRTVAQTLQCTNPIPHNAYFATEMCTHVHISFTNWCIVGYLSDALCDLWYWTIIGMYRNCKLFYMTTVVLVGCWKYLVVSVTYNLNNNTLMLNGNLQLFSLDKQRHTCLKFRCTYNIYREL